MKTHRICWRRSSASYFWILQDIECLPVIIATSPRSNTSDWREVSSSISLSEVYPVDWLLSTRLGSTPLVMRLVSRKSPDSHAATMPSAVLAHAILEQFLEDELAIGVWDPGRASKSLHDPYRKGLSAGLRWLEEPRQAGSFAQVATNVVSATMMMHIIGLMRDS